MKNNNDITIDDIITAVRTLASDSPDNVYKHMESGACSYVKGKCSDGSIGCIFGQAFRELDIDIPADFETVPIKTVLGVVCSMSESILEKINWCREVQLAQDRKETWKAAVTKADIIVGIV